MDATTNVTTHAPTVLGVKSAATYLGVHKNTVYRWLKTGKLAALYFAGVYLIAQDELDRCKRSSQRVTHD